MFGDCWGMPPLPRARLRRSHARSYCWHEWCGPGVPSKSRVAYRPAYPAAYSCLSRAKVHPGGQAQHITISARDKRTRAFPRARQSDAALPRTRLRRSRARRYRWHEWCGPTRCSFQITCCLSWYPPPTSTSPTATPLASLIVLLISVLIHAYLGTA